MATFSEATTNLSRQLRTGWGNMGPLQKLPIVLATVVVFAALIFLSFRMGNPNYAVLFANLSDTDAAEITSALQENGVRYRLAENGSAILVPSNEVYQRRLDMASKGLPRGGVVGFEIFDQTSLGQTDFEREVKYRRALEGELVRTIREFQNIADARVHLALPERSAFVRDQGKATASVVLHLKPGARLTNTQIAGIANLVACSVEGLQAEEVVIVDSMGNVLSDTKATADILASGTVLEQLQVQRTWEGSLEDRIRSNLESIYGTGEVLVMVTADMDFDAQEETKEIYEPAVPGGLARTVTTEESSDVIPVTLGISGVTNDGNADLENIATTLGKGSSLHTRANSVVYDHNYTMQRRVIAPGQLNSLAVAVMVDGSLTSADREKIRNTVITMANGVTGGRIEPQVAVDSAMFQQQEIEDWPLEPAAPVASKGVSNRLPIYLIIGGVGLAMCTLLAVMLRRQPKQQEINMAVAQKIAEAQTAAALAQSVEDSKDEQRREIESMAKQRPAEFASLIRSWLSEES
jgi:flagellar M-ring protein FliF